MKKRGQISVFLIAGLVVLLALGLMLMLRSPSKLGEDYEQQALRQDSMAVQQYVSSCLKEELIKASEFGLRYDLRDKQKEYIQTELKKCADFSVFKGVKVESSDINYADVLLSDSVFSAYVTFPIVISRGSSKITIERFYEQLVRSVSLPLSEGSGGGSSIIVSSDKKSELKFGSDVTAKKDGAKVNEIGLKIVDSGIENAGSEVVVGNIVYQGFPEGAELEPGAELTISYYDEGLPVSEQELVIARYNPDSKLWEPLESQVNSDSNKVTATVRQLGAFAVVHGWKSETFLESSSWYDSSSWDEGSSVVDAGNCFSGALEQFPVKGNPNFVNDWGFARVQGGHEGTDVFAPVGTEIVAAVSGIVAERECLKLGGNAFGIRDKNGIFYYYAHMSAYGNYALGEKVNAGDVIGYVGTTIGCQSCSSGSGLCGIPDQTSPHLHFGVYVGMKAQNPYCTLRASKSGSTAPNPVSTIPVSYSPGNAGGQNAITKLSPNHGGRMSGHKGVIIHSTRGGTAVGTELQATVNWFMNPSSQVSSHRVVGYNGEQYIMVDDDIVAWHAGNTGVEYLGIEIEQGRASDPFSEQEYIVAAKIVRDWSKKYGFPVNRQTVMGHDEIPQGIRQGKSDPGYMFDWDKFMRLASSDSDIVTV